MASSCGDRSATPPSSLSCSPLEERDAKQLRAKKSREQIACPRAGLKVVRLNVDGVVTAAEIVDRFAVDGWLYVNGVVTATEGDEGFAVVRRPNRLQVHPVNQLEVVAVMPAPHDQEARGLVGVVAI